MENREREMLLVGLAGIVVGNAMGVVLMCVLVTGKRADEEMERYRTQMEVRKISFKDIHDQVLFCVPDGACIELTAPNGEKQTGICHYIDKNHVRIGEREWNLLDFARQMQTRGILYAPV